MRERAGKTPPLISVSSGGDDRELAERGLGMEHVNELIVRVAQQLLSDGNRLAFGGTLGDCKQKLTQYLIETAQNWLGNDCARDCDVTNPKTWPLLNYSAWPFHTFISERERANLTGVCGFEDINPPGVSKPELEQRLKDWKVSPQAQIYIGDSLSEMREQSTRDSDLRITWAGKIKCSSGWISGILEEVGYSLAQDKPILILGGYGGCAGLIAKYLISEDEPWPDPLILNTGAEEMLSDSAWQAVEIRFEKIQTDLTHYRTQLNAGADVKALPNGVLIKALKAENGHEITSLVAQAAAAVAR